MVGQMDLDDHLKQLVDFLDEVFIFLYDAYQLNNIKTLGSASQLHTLKCIIDQTTECGHFISAYAKDVSYCKMSAFSVYYLNIEMLCREKAYQEHGVRG
jgi:hypothetical protein